MGHGIIRDPPATAAERPLPSRNEPQNGGPQKPARSRQAAIFQEHHLSVCWQFLEQPSRAAKAGLLREAP